MQKKVFDYEETFLPIAMLKSICIFYLAIKIFGFDQNVDELCVYKCIKNEKVIFLVLYVDDLILQWNGVGMLSSVKLWLTQKFRMKDLGGANYVMKI